VIKKGLRKQEEKVRTQDPKTLKEIKMSA
jgi:hypothetical protein